MATLKEHHKRSNRIRMAVAKGDWDEYDRIVEECIKEAENKSGRSDGNRIDLEGVANGG